MEQKQLTEQTNDLNVPRFEIEITFWDNVTHEEINRSAMSNDGDNIIQELKELVRVLKGIA